jgi:hypothetical protein
MGSTTPAHIFLQNDSCKMHFVLHPSFPAFSVFGSKLKHPCRKTTPIISEVKSELREREREERERERSEEEREKESERE